MLIVGEERLQLVRPRSVLVEYIEHSGLLSIGDTELFVFYEEKDRRATMQVRVLDAHPSCAYAEVGKVYLTKPFRDEEFLTPRGERMYEMHEQYLEAEVVGYDERAQELADAHEGDGYPVCGK